MLRALRQLFFLTWLLCISTLAAPAAPFAPDTVVRTDNETLSKHLNVPVYQWCHSTHKPKIMVLAIHGMTMHGAVYDTWARKLAAQNIMVAAPDLRGYGAWYASGNIKSVNYKDSEQDLVALAQELRQRHQGIPLFVAGESLGATLALRLAARHPDLVDGLILSSPAIRHCHQIPLKTIADGVRVFANPCHKVDLSDYIKHYFSENPAIAAEQIADPLVRKNLNLAEIVSSCRVMNSSADAISTIPSDMPVLVLQGKKDRMVKLQSVDMLEKRLQSNKRTVCWFPQRGHILLETAHISAETVNRINEWLAENGVMRTLGGATVAASNEHSPFVISEAESRYLN
jgi:acylglycerol lipase